MVAYCAVYNCRKHLERSRERVTFFRFPTDKSQREQWLQRLKLKGINPSLRVCSRHFSSESFEVSPEIFKSIGWTAKVKLKLIDGAIPTKLLSSLNESGQQNAQQQRVIQQQQIVTPTYDHPRNADIAVLEKLNRRQLLLRSDLEEEDAPCLQRELRLEMVGTINSQHPVVKIEVDEDSPNLQNAASLHPVLKVEDHDEETIVHENFGPANVKIEVHDENNSSFVPELVQDRSAPERRVKIEIVEEADESPTLSDICDVLLKKAITKMDASIQTVCASDEAQDKRIRKITITFVSAKRQKTHADVGTQTRSEKGSSTV